MSDTGTVFTWVSFMKTPLLEISTKGNAILSAGWEFVEAKPHLWIASFSKDFPIATKAAEAEKEIQAIMGEYYMSADEMNESEPAPPQNG
jgi:hypothetical protein